MTPVYSSSDLTVKSQTPASKQTENGIGDGSNKNTPTQFAPTSTPTPDPYSTLYDCNMEIKFTSGPLESKSTDFKVLGLDYFQDKGDKFDPGKGTSIYYQDQHYFILHSSYVHGNILRPMQAEFIRKYLEYWGESGSKYIEGQMQALIGSNVLWYCNDKLIFRTNVDSIIRLSHEAANDIWLNPENLQQIIFNREGLDSEWIGEMAFTSNPDLYIGFCGWGPQSKGDERFTYFRYLIRFKIE